jgi:2-polyprenyl-3-methyl-5-hydroxy-6-metoxy-1,4-benzoquinol methylase
MFNYLSKIITSNNPNLFFIKALLILAIILLAIYLYRITESPYSKKNKAQEGFHQDHPYVLKQNQNIYDDFYAEMYDGVNNRDEICQRELFQIIKMTEPTIKNSIFLDVGSGTGCVVNELTNAGYDTYGIDKSNAMVDYAESKYPNISIKNADVLDPMIFENGLFTHVLCLNMTIYEFSNKSQFFSNCYYWMKPNAYLVVHLVNPSKLSTKKYLKFKDQFTTLYDSFMPEKDNDVPQTTIVADFADCKYQESFQSSKTTSKVMFKQTFTDKVSKNIRENEQSLHMESIDEILNIAKRAGFIVHAKTGMKAINRDENQYLYVFERAL